MRTKGDTRLHSSPARKSELQGFSRCVHFGQEPSLPEAGLTLEFRTSLPGQVTQMTQLLLECGTGQGEPPGAVLGQIPHGGTFGNKGPGPAQC